MSTSVLETLRTFVEPILDEYGIKHARTKRGSMHTTVEYKSDAVWVVFEKDDRDGVVHVELIELQNGEMLVYDSIADLIADSHGAIGLSRLLALRAPDLEEELAPKSWPPTKDYHLQQIPLIARAFDLYCRDILSGDFSVRKAVIERARREYQKEGLQWPSGFPLEELEERRRLPDETLRARVEEEIRAMVAIDTSRVSTNVRHGVIYMSGEVDTLRQKELVEFAAFSVLNDQDRFESTIRIRQQS